MLRNVGKDSAGTDVGAVTSAVLAASRLLVAISVKSLAEVEERVTVAQFRLLALLDRHGESNLVTLADRLMVNPSTAFRMVDRIAAAGLVSRTVNPASRREILLRLTPAGEQLVAQVTARRREEIAAIVARMPTEGRDTLVQALRAFISAGGEQWAQEQTSAPLDWD